MDKKDLLEIIKKILKTDADLDFLLNLTEKQATDVVDLVLDGFKDTLSKDGRIEIWIWEFQRTKK
jgi:nucleoid DNA-binding protein